MNQHRHYQQQQQQQSGGSQSSQSQYRSNGTLEYLKREKFRRELLIEQVHTKIDALGQKGALLEAEQRAHLLSIPGAMAQVLLTTIGVRSLPAAARHWYYKHQRLQEAEMQLRYQAIALHTQLQTLENEIELLTIEIDIQQNY